MTGHRAHLSVRMDCLGLSVQGKAKFIYIALKKQCNVLYRIKRIKIPKQTNKNVLSKIRGYKIQIKAVSKTYNP